MLVRFLSTPWYEAMIGWYWDRIEKGVVPDAAAVGIGEDRVAEARCS